MLVSSEENYKKLFNDNENLKAEVNSMKSSQAHVREENKEITNNFAQNLNTLDEILNSKLTGKSLEEKIDKYNKLNPNFNISEISQQRISIEYLKNVLLKYLEAISIGNEFQTKILENVIFTILHVSQTDKTRLEEKRSRSSFYYNLWYNAKAFLSAKIYGQNLEDLQIEHPGMQGFPGIPGTQDTSSTNSLADDDPDKENKETLSLDDLNIVSKKKENRRTSGEI